MRPLVFAPLAGVSLALTTGCVVTLPFNARPTFNHVSEARTLDAKQKGPIRITWDPSDFPERIDTQGASGFVGGGSQTRIPTGVAIAARVSELLDAAVGVSPASDKAIKIKVVNAESKFEYSGNIFNVTPSIDFGSCTVDLEFVTPTQTWRKTFSATHKDAEVGGTSTTGVLEKAWDDVALQIAKDITSHLQ